MSINQDLRRLQKLLYVASSPDCGFHPGDDMLARLLSETGSVEEAAYRACLEFAESTSMRLEGGTTTSEQRKYWLTLAQTFRPNRGRVLKRADEGGSE